MKRKNSLKNSRKRIIQATVAAVAGITVAVAAFRPVETSANGVLPGVESIVAQKMATEDKTYRILEIMPDGAESEMGYLAAGSEPVALADGMHRSPIFGRWSTSTPITLPSYCSAASTADV